MKIKITRLTKTKPNSVSITRYVHRQLRKLWQDSIQVFVTQTTLQLGKRRGNTQGKPFVDTGMSISVLIPLAVYSEPGVRIGKGSLVKDYALNYTRDAITASEFKTNGEKRGKDRTRKRGDGRAAGENAFKLSFGTPNQPILEFEFNIPGTAEGVPQLDQHRELQQAFFDGGKAMSAFFQDNLTKYVRNKDLLAYLSSGKTLPE